MSKVRKNKVNMTDKLQTTKKRNSTKVFDDIKIVRDYLGYHEVIKKDPVEEIARQDAISALYRIKEANKIEEESETIKKEHSNLEKRISEFEESDSYEKFHLWELGDLASDLIERIRNLEKCLNR